MTSASKRRWTTAEILYLHRCRPHRSVKELARDLNRGVDSVEYKLARLKIKRRRYEAETKVSVYLTNAERQKITLMANARELSISQFIRDLVMETIDAKTSR